MSSPEANGVLPAHPVQGPESLGLPPDPDPGHPFDASNLMHLLILLIAGVFTVYLRLVTNVALGWCILAGIILWLILYVIVLLILMVGMEFEDPFGDEDSWNE